MKTEIEITGLEEDILKEIINIGLAKVADSFAIMAKQPVMLHIPRIEMVSIEALDKVLPENEAEDAIIESDIDGDIHAKSFLIFKPEQSAKISDSCIGSKESFAGNYNAMQKSLLLEISNILTGALITQFANIFHMDLVGMPPVSVPFRLRKTFAELIANLIISKPIVLTVKTNFLNMGQEVDLPMILVFDVNSMLKILSIIRKQNIEDANWLAHQK